MRKIKTGDEVIVITGKDKGKRGIVSKVVNQKLYQKTFTKAQRAKEVKIQTKVIIEGINVVKKHIKANPLKGQVGGVIKKSMPIDISNVAIFNPTTNRADKVGFKFINDQKVRYFKSSGELIKK